MTVISFPTQASVFQFVPHYIRLGEMSYRKIAELAASGVIQSKRFVVDGSKISFQRDIIQVLKGLGAEIVLDPRTIELSSLRKCSGLASTAPWAAISPKSPLSPDVFKEGHANDIYGMIARCAVENGVNAVLSPSHYLADPDFQGWQFIDYQACILLRKALDLHGGKSISIDYLLAARLTDFTDEEFQAQIVQNLSELPYDNLWVRPSMSNALGPVNAQRLVRTLARWHNLGKPIIMDYMHGLAAESLVALNVVSGIAHGFGEQTSFKANDWSKPSKERDKSKRSGRAVRVSISALGCTFTRPEFEVLMTA